MSRKHDRWAGSSSTHRASCVWVPFKAQIQQNTNRTQLTGKQNSSKAGLTNVMYWDRICSRSLPRSLMSRNTERGRRGVRRCAGRPTPPPCPRTVHSRPEERACLPGLAAASSGCDSALGAGLLTGLSVQAALTPTHGSVNGPSAGPAHGGRQTGPQGGGLPGQGAHSQDTFPWAYVAPVPSLCAVSDPPRACPPRLPHPQAPQRAAGRGLSVPSHSH